MLSPPNDLKRVATPELLDSIATNAMGLRLGDVAFAAEVYEGVRDQAIRAPERWYDAHVRIRLSEHRPTTGNRPDASNRKPDATMTHRARSRNAAKVAPAETKSSSSIGGGFSLPVPQFDVLVQWDYTVTPSHPVRKFACTSDRDEFRDLISEVPQTSAWYMVPRPGLSASDQASFELLRFAVDGKEKKIRRSERKTGQTYSVNLGDDVVRAGKPVKISHTYRTIVPADVHGLFIAVAQPTKNIAVTMDYTDTNIDVMYASELVSTAKRSRLAAMPEEVPAKAVTVDVPGWILPPAQFTYVWSLASERHPAKSAADQDRAAA